MKETPWKVGLGLLVAAGCRGAEPRVEPALVASPSPSTSVHAPAASASAVAPTVAGDAACVAAYRALDLRRGYSGYAPFARTLDEARAQGEELGRVAAEWERVAATIVPGPELDAASPLGAAIAERARLLSTSPPAPPAPKPTSKLPPLPASATPVDIAKRAALEDAAEFGMLGMIGDPVFTQTVNEALKKNRHAIHDAATAFFDVCLVRIPSDAMK